MAIENDSRSNPSSKIEFLETFSHSGGIEERNSRSPPMVMKIPTMTTTIENNPERSASDFFQHPKKLQRRCPKRVSLIRKARVKIEVKALRFIRKFPGR